MPVLATINSVDIAYGTICDGCSASVLLLPGRPMVDAMGPRAERIVRAGGLRPRVLASTVTDRQTLSDSIRWNHVTLGVGRWECGACDHLHNV